MKPGKEIEAIQVCYDLGDEETIDRELRGLKAAKEELGASKLTLITFDEQREFSLGKSKGRDHKIKSVPFYVWAG